MSNAFMNNNHYCVILAGGIGMRLWPSSRQNKPKQFIDILGNGETLLQSTYKRVAKLVSHENILVTTNEQYIQLVRNQLPDVAESNLLLEPMRRNTLPSATWATVEIMHRNRNAKVLVVPADQILEREEGFDRDVQRAFDYIETHNKIISLGITPLAPETNYGYVQMGERQDEQIFKVKTFVEKPDMEWAKVLQESGEFLWNTGIFIWSAQTFIGYVHDRWMQFDDMISKVKADELDHETKRQIVEDVFAICPNLTIEHVCLENNDVTDVMLAHFGWSDIGTWHAIYQKMPKDDDGNAVLAQNALLYECKECLVKAENGKLIVVQGLNDYLVVDDANTLVICRKDDEKAIRKFVNDIKVSMGDEFV